MPAYRLLNQSPQYLLPSGKVNAGGSISTYETDLTTPKLTWSDPDQMTPNANPIQLDSAGRTVTDVWCDGEYGEVVKDALGATIWTRNNVRPGDGTAATALPTLDAGQFISSDGTTLIAVDILQLPDMTGETGNILYTDGVLSYWAAPPTLPVVPEPDIVVTSTSFRGGTSSSTTKFLIQTGTGSAPASGSQNTSTSVAFPVPFATLLHVAVTQKHNGVTANGTIPSQSNTVESATGFDIRFSTNDNSPNSAWNIINSVPFSWVAFGTVVVAP